MGGHGHERPLSLPLWRLRGKDEKDSIPGTKTAVHYTVIPVFLSTLFSILFFTDAFNQRGFRHVWWRRCSVCVASRVSTVTVLTYASRSVRTVVKPVPLGWGGELLRHYAIRTPAPIYLVISIAAKRMAADILTQGTEPEAVMKQGWGYTAYWLPGDIPDLQCSIPPVNELILCKLSASIAVG